MWLGAVSRPQARGPELTRTRELWQSWVRRGAGPLDFTDLVFREKTVMGSMSGHGLFDEAIQMMRSRFKGNATLMGIRLEHLIEGRVPSAAHWHKHVKTLPSPH
jgi:hypothetical protein